MSLDADTSGDMLAWAALTTGEQPARGTAAPVRPARYEGRHRRGEQGKRTGAGRWIVAEPVASDYNPLTVEQRMHLAPTVFGQADTTQIDPARVRATTVVPAPPAAVLAELRLDLEQTRAELSDPIGDARRIWRQTTGEAPPAVRADDTQRIEAVQ